MSAALMVRSTVEPAADYKDYREPLRFDFWFACAYCSMTEIEAAGLRFTIDHYECRNARPDLESDYSNLMWSCGHCNELKGDLDPPAAARMNGDRLLRPDQDDERDHLAIDHYRVKGVTNPGRFTEEVLDLNRQTLRRLREIRERLDASREHILRGLAGLRNLSPERLPLEVRGKYLQIRADLDRRSLNLEEKLHHQALRHLGRSPLLDADPDNAERAKTRRKFLADKKAVYGDAFRRRRRKT